LGCGLDEIISNQPVRTGKPSEFHGGKSLHGTRSKSKRASWMKTVVKLSTS
jgi:hypothetical protein